MCSVCGVLDGPTHWSQAIGRLKLAQTTTVRAERARTVALLNRIAGTRRAKVSDWQGTQWLVAGPTGALRPPSPAGLGRARPHRRPADRPACRRVAGLMAAR